VSKKIAIFYKHWMMREEAILEMAMVMMIYPVLLVLLMAMTMSIWD